MRTFSDLEKQAMNIIAEISPKLIPSQNLETLVYHLFEGFNVSFDYNPIGQQFSFTYQTDDEKGAQTISDISNKLLSLQILFEYLESLYLVRLYNNNINGGKFKDNDKKIKFDQEIKDERINKFFCDNWLSTFIVTEAFRTFVKNDFKTEDQIYNEKTLSEAKRQTRSARITLIVAIITLVASIISPFIMKLLSS